MGSLLQLASGLGAVARRRIAEGARRVRADLEAVPSDVCKHRYRDRQCARAALCAMGALDRLRVPAPVSWEADAGPHDAWRAACRARTQLTAYGGTPIGTNGKMRS